MDLQRFVAATLSRHGCATETVGEDAVRVLLDPEAARAMDLADESCLRLRGPGDPGEVQAGLGSGVLSRICSLNGSLGGAYRVELVPPSPKLERVEREAASLLAFQNGVARLESIEGGMLVYLVADSRYAALSEDGHEGIVSVALGEDGGNSPQLATGLVAFLDEHPESRRPWTGDGEQPDAGARIQRVHRSALAAALSETQPFVSRMSRRLRRDSQRVTDYYETLRHEVERRRDRGRDPAAIQRKIEAIGTESSRRIDDLRRRYTVRLQLEPLSILWVRIAGLRIRVRIRRRKRESVATLGWNAVAREIDRWTCDACGTEIQVPTLCDALHRLCGSCAGACPTCRRQAD